MDDNKKDIKDKKDTKSGTFNASKYINIEPKLNEAAKKDLVVIGFGRMNPITIGHEKLVNKVVDIASKRKGVPNIFLSHSNDPKKNPLTYDQKIKYAQLAFGTMITKSKSKTIIQIAVELQSKYKKLVMVAGSDRVDAFNELLNKYNGKDYTFDSIEVVSAGERDPDAEGISGISASKMRKLAAENNLEEFTKGLPKKIQSSADEILKDTRMGMKLSEGVFYEALNPQQRRARAKTMKRLAPKIARARARSMKKKAPIDKLKGRARKQAINVMKDKLAKGKSYGELSYNQRQKIDDRIKKIGTGKINTLSRKLLPSVRDKEKQRFANLNKKESVNVAFEQFLEERNLDEVCRNDKVMTRPHLLLTKNGEVKYDKRFKLYKTKNKEISDIIDKELEVCESTGDKVINLKDIFDLQESIEALTEVAKIACLKCDEVSTTKAWAKNDDICPKCKKSTQGVAESLEEAKKIGSRVEITKGPYKGKIGYVRIIKKGEYGNPSARKLDIDLEDGGEAVVYTKDTKLVKESLDENKLDKPYEKSWFGMGDTRSEKEITDQVKGLSNETLKIWSANKAGRFGSKIAKLQGRLVAAEMKKRGLSEALEKDSDDPCWKDYVQLGTKKKNGKEVPNCVPKESLDEAVTWGMFNAAEMAKDFKQAKAVTLKTETKLAGCKVIPNSKKFDLEDEGIIPMLKFFSRGAKTKTVTVPAGSDITIDTQNGYAYGMVGKEFFKYEIMKDAFDEPLKDLAEAKTSYKGLYNVVKDGKVINKQPMTTQQALDHYDSLGGKAKGYAVNEERVFDGAIKTYAPSIAKFLDKKIFKKNYEKAIETLINMNKKDSKNIPRNIVKAAGVWDVDHKILRDMFNDTQNKTEGCGGAGDIGTDKLRKKYQEDTPKQKKTFKDIKESSKYDSAYTRSARNRERNVGVENEKNTQNAKKIFKLRVDGKILNGKDGMPMTWFNSASATKAARTMMSKSFNKGKEFALVTESI